MQLANQPTKVQLPFADSGNKRVVPVPSQQGVTPGAASWTDGFPPATMQPVTSGGVPPSGLDFNGVLNEISALSRWFSSGGSFPFDATYAASIGGYPQGARVLNAAGAGYWLNTVDNNSNAPGPGSGWIPSGVSGAASVYASAQQTLGAGTSKVIFDSVEFDGLQLWDGVNNRFIAQYPGIYRVNGCVQLTSPSGEQLATQIFKNGNLAKHCFEAPQVSTGNLALPFETILQLAANDYVEIFVQAYAAGLTVGLPGNDYSYVFAQCQYLGS